MHFSKIVIATDFSDASYAAFETAAYNQRMEAAEVFLLHVHQYFEPPLEFAALWNPHVMVDYAEQYKARADAKLESLVRHKFHGEKVSYQTIITSKPPGDEIVAFGNKVRADLLLLGSKGHTALGGLFLGSTVQRVLLIATCPVLVIPARSE